MTSSVSHAIMTVGRVGMVRRAPGTVASGVVLLPVVLWHAFLPHFGSFLALTVLVTIAGYLAIRLGDPGWINQDPPAIVIDEAAGQLIAFLPLSWARSGGTLSIAWLLLFSLVAFGLFRVLDISKPAPIGWADRLKGSLGIMLDDILAGTGAAVVLLIILGLLGWE